MWRQAAASALEERKRQFFEGGISRLWAEANAIPIADRRGWRESDAYQEHRGDLESFLHQRAGTTFDDDAGEYLGPAPRLVRFSNKPWKGTRPKIIAAIAERFGVPESRVDRLWKEYRRFEAEASGEE